MQPECLIGCDCAARWRKNKVEAQNKFRKTYRTAAVEVFCISLNPFLISYFRSISFMWRRQRSSRGTYHVKQWVWWWHWSRQHCWRRRTRIWLHLGACARAEFWAPNQSRRRTLSPAGARDKIMLKEFFWSTMNEGPSTGKRRNEHENKQTNKTKRTNRETWLTTLMVTDETCFVRQKALWCRGIELQQLASLSTLCYVRDMWDDLAEK